jgi:hypothetical protein
MADNEYIEKKKREYGEEFDISKINIRVRFSKGGDIKRFVSKTINLIRLNQPKNVYVKELL